jgi:flagellar biosynthesis protein
MKRDDRTKPPRQAVALHYDGKGAPRVTAKGQGYVADAILSRAREHGVPLHEDAMLAATLAQLDLGEEIPEALYRAVAQVLAFAYFLSGKTPPLPERRRKHG